MIGRNGSNGAPGGARGAAAPDDTPDGHFHINARLDRVALRQGVAIAPFNLDLAGIGNRLAALALSGIACRQDGAHHRQPGNHAGRPQAYPQCRRCRAAGARACSPLKACAAASLSVTANLPGRASDPVNQRSRRRIIRAR